MTSDNRTQTTSICHVHFLDGSSVRPHSWSRAGWCTGRGELEVDLRIPRYATPLTPILHATQIFNLTNTSHSNFRLCSLACYSPGSPRNPPCPCRERQDLRVSRSSHLAAHILLPSGTFFGPWPTAPYPNIERVLAPILLPAHWHRLCQHGPALLDILCHRGEPAR